MILLAAILASTQPDRSDAVALAPAPQSAILAGARACIGATVDPDGQSARVAGWEPVTPEQRASMKTDGDVLTRDNVMLVYKAGEKGGCVVLGQGDASFSRSRFLADLSAAAGRAINDKQPRIELPNGEIMVVRITKSPTPRSGASSPNPSNNYVVVVIANSAAEAAKHSKGN